MLAQVVVFFRNILRFHKLKILSVFFFALIFFVLLFPFNDLSDLVTRKVAEQTRDQVFLQFDQLGFDLYPQIGLGLENVLIETAQFPAIRAKYLSLAPSITGLLSFRPGFNLKGRGIFKGNLDLDFKTGETLESEGQKTFVDLKVSDLDIAQLGPFLKLPLQTKGQGQARVDFFFDSAFGIQPEGEYQIGIKNLQLLSGSIPTQMGPIVLPQINLTDVILNGRLAGGKFVIEQGQFGSAKDPIQGKIKGQIDLKFENTRAGLSPMFGPYDIRIDINIAQASEKDLSLFLFPLDSQKTKTPTGSRYLVRISGPSFQSVPRMEKINSVE